MSNKTITEIAERIGAVKVGPRLWAYYADETRSWWVVSANDLLSYDGDYSQWCARTTARRPTAAEARMLGL